MPRRNQEPLTQAATENRAVRYIPVRVFLYLFTRTFIGILGPEDMFISNCEGDTKRSPDEIHQFPRQSRARPAVFLAPDSVFASQLREKVPSRLDLRCVFSIGEEGGLSKHVLEDTCASTGYTTSSAFPSAKSVADEQRLLGG